MNMQTRERQKMTDTTTTRVTFLMALEARDALNEARENGTADEVRIAVFNLADIEDALGGYDAVWTPVPNPIGRNCDD